MLYRIPGTITVSAEVLVEAEDFDAAFHKALKGEYTEITVDSPDNRAFEPDETVSPEDCAVV